MMFPSVRLFLLELAMKDVLVVKLFTYERGLERIESATVFAF